MKRTLSLLLLLSVGVCMTTPSYAQDLINGALTAMGGAEALAQVKTLIVKGTVRTGNRSSRWWQAARCGTASDATFEMTGDFTSHGYAWTG